MVAYYGELLKKNDSRLNDENFLDPFIELDSFGLAVKSLYESLKRFGTTKKAVAEALKEGLEAEKAYRSAVKKKAGEIVEEARKQHKRIIVLAGRPYHVDPEINHGIDKLLDSLDVAVVSEDGFDYDKPRLHTKVLNQWTYHARLYEAARMVSENPDMELVQLISFGCGVDAITSDETRRILEEKGRLYTQIKIDEINNLGAVRIRLRSLLSAAEERERRAKNA